jgi:hypothetical protein
LRQVRRVIIELQEERKRVCQYDLDRLDAALAKVTWNAIAEED